MNTTLFNDKDINLVLEFDKGSSVVIAIEETDISLSLEIFLRSLYEGWTWKNRWKIKLCLQTQERTNGNWKIFYSLFNVIIVLSKPMQFFNQYCEPSITPGEAFINF